MSAAKKDLALAAHLQGRLHTLDLVESIAEYYGGLNGPDAIRRACKLVRDSVMKQAALERVVKL